MFCRAACQAGASPPTNPMIKAKMIALLATAGVMRNANTTSLKRYGIRRAGLHSIERKHQQNPHQRPEQGQ